MGTPGPASDAPTSSAHGSANGSTAGAATDDRAHPLARPGTGLPDGLRPSGDPTVRTLSIDCGGTGLKASVLDAQGVMLAERVRVTTPYPCSPETMVATLVALVQPLPAYDRVSVGFPGMVRRGRVLATPHYVMDAGPFTTPVPELVAAWHGFDIQTALAASLGRPTRVANDAEVQGAAAIKGRGLEVALTLGTGLGCAIFDGGYLLPHFEVSHAPFRKKQTYDQQLGNHARKQIGNAAWNRRVRRAVDSLRPVLHWDHLYLGGGNAPRIEVDLGPDVTFVPNEWGILGGIRLWDVAVV